jgi:endo-1,4-beta-xylanase
MDRYEYVVKAFEWARKYADENGGQNVKLYLTDYGIERRFPDTPPEQKSKIDGFEDLVDYLIEKNAPIDGVGFQGHFRLYDHPVEQISAGIDRFSAKEKADGTKLTVQVCELDFSVFSNAKSEAGDNKTTIPNDKLAERLTDLAQTYLDFFNMFEEKFEEGKLTMVLIWGIADKHSWLNNDPVSGRTDYPLLFDRDYNPKKAFYKLAGCDDETDYDGEELHTKWSFPLGVAVPGASTTNTQNNNAFQADNPQYPLLRHFNVVVAENEMKPSNIMPSSASDF